MKYRFKILYEDIGYSGLFNLLEGYYKWTDYYWRDTDEHGFNYYFIIDVDNTELAMLIRLKYPNA